VAVILVFMFNPGLLKGAQTQFSLWIENAGPWGWALLIALMVAHSFIPFPLEFAAVAAGAIYGFWLGSLLTWFGALLGGMLSFWLARWLGKPFLDRVLNDRQSAWLEARSREQGAIALLISRFLPFISFTLLSYAAGLTAVSWWTFIWTTSIGMLPLTAVAVYYGANIDVMRTEWVIAIPVVAIIAVVVLHLVARRKGWIGGIGG
ncbi:MAG: TVP38/TMEM64 family protein, partial [Alphaproteobacteria bacterium]|nr:TVP38/TMEM64 family protein [Alphaproteobacteria bacterium]